ncbi:MAG: hypothetical protein FJ040_06700 [Chloroflexi bacterium]|nr:hypothetical protein [Chloroflexota bacterium]
MSNSYTKTTRNSWGSRVANSFIGVLFGFLLIPLSIWGLWWNEGQPDLSVIAEASVAVDATQVSAENDGKFVAATGVLQSDATLGDEPWMQPGNYVSLYRRVEMYAWNETSRTEETEDAIGGGSTTTTTYTYNKEWTESPSNSSSFEIQTGHENPAKPYESLTSTVAKASVGKLAFDAQQISLPSGEKISPQPGQLPEGYVIKGDYIYNRDAAASTPEVGDIRISFDALKSGITVTVLAQQQGNSLIPVTVEEQKFFRVFVGSRVDALETLHNEYLVFVWMVRVFGVLGIFIGLQLIVGPIGRILGVIGIVGKAVDGIFGLINGLLALAIGTTVIIISQIFHNIWLLLITIAIIVGITVYYLRKRSAKIGPDSDSPVDTSPPTMT